MEDKKVNEVFEKCKCISISKNGISTLSLLGIVLIVLKALGYIGISWFWVTAPLWIPVALILISFITILCMSITAAKKATDIAVEEIKKQEVIVKTKAAVKEESTKESVKELTKENTVETAVAKPKKKRERKKEGGY